MQIRELIAENSNDSDRDYYAILNILRNATTEQVSKAYHNLALKFHPDKNNTADSSRFVAINKAYAVLRDPVKRAKYDRNSRFERFCQKNQCLEGAETIRRRELVTLIFNIPSSYIRQELLTHLSSIMSSSIAPELVMRISRTYSRMPHSFYPSPAPTLALPPTSSNQQLLDDLGVTEIPERFICPLSSEVMDEPVSNPNKGLPPVEKAWALKAIESSNGKNPFNNQPLTKEDLIPDLELQKEIKEFISSAQANNSKNNNESSAKSDASELNNNQNDPEKITSLHDCSSAFFDSRAATSSNQQTIDSSEVDEKIAACYPPL